MKLELSEQQVNLILQALAQLPYAQVSSLIEEIIKQAKSQLESEKSKI